MGPSLQTDLMIRYYQSLLALFDWASGLAVPSISSISSGIPDLCKVRQVKS